MALITSSSISKLGPDVLWTIVYEQGLEGKELEALLKALSQTCTFFRSFPFPSNPSNPDPIYSALTERKITTYAKLLQEVHEGSFTIDNVLNEYNRKMTLLQKLLRSQCHFDRS